MAITLNGVALQNASAPALFQTCRFPIVDLKRYRTPDEVVQNMNTFIGGWGDDTIAPAMKSQVIDIDTSTNSGDACRFPIVAMALTSCDWVAPNQKVIGLESQQINWSTLVTRFCTVNNIAVDRLGTIFNGDGTLNPGNPYTLNFVKFVVTALAEAEGISLTHSAMVGDYANVNQFDGLYNQIDNGWETGDVDCGATLNTGNSVNWDSMTGGNGSGNASPDATTVATTVTLWGQSFNIPEGWTLGDFLAWYAEGAAANYGAGRNVEWEMHAPNGWRMAVLKALTCIQLCNNNNFLTDNLVARYARLVSGKVAELFGYGVTFPIFETAYAGTNTLRFGPRAVDGVPTYGLVFEDIAAVIAQLDPLGAALYGSQQGIPGGADDPLISMTRDQIANRFEARTVHFDFMKVSPICVRASIMLKAGLLATDRHFWLKITHVGVNNFRLAAPSDFTVNGGAAPVYS